MSEAALGGNDDDEDMDVSEANNLVSEASKLSAGARIFRGPQGPEILVDIYMPLLQDILII